MALGEPVHHERDARDRRDLLLAELPAAVPGGMVVLPDFFLSFCFAFLVLTSATWHLCLRQAQQPLKVHTHLTDSPAGLLLVGVNSDQKLQVPFTPGAWRVPCLPVL